MNILASNRYAFGSKFRIVFFLLALMTSVRSYAKTLDICEGSAKPWRERYPDIPPEVARFLPDQAQEVAFVAMPAEGGSAPHFAIMSWSYRDADQIPHSQIVIVGPLRRDGTRRLLRSTPIEELYNPEIIKETSFTFHKTPVILVQRQAGAALAQMEVIGIKRRRPHILQTLYGEGFEQVRMEATSRVLVVSHAREEGLEIPILLAWNGRKFVDVSAQFPSYYQKIRDAILEDGIDQHSPWSIVALARLTSLSGHPEQAEKELTIVRQHEVEKGSDADSALLERIDQDLKELK